MREVFAGTCTARWSRGRNGLRSRPMSHSKSRGGDELLALALLGITACAGADDSHASEGLEAGSVSSGEDMHDGSGETADAPDDGVPLYVKASNTDAGDLFGVAVALSGDGRVLAVGANREASGSTGIGGDQTDDAAPDAGAVYLFSGSGRDWHQVAYLKASNTGAGDAFGTSVALSADGNTLAVGAIFEASAATGIDGDGLDDSAPDAGAVYVFVRDGDTWAQQAYLKASNAAEGDLFGISLALASDGNTLVVGAEGEDSAATGVDGDASNDAAFDSGAVHVFSREGAAWRQSAYLKASNTDAGDRFGIAVALSSRGDTLAVGAHGEDSLATEVDGNQDNDAAASAGAVYVFVHDGVSWQQQAYLKPARSDGQGGDTFGCSVSLSGDGDTLAIGAAGDSSAASGIDGDPNDASAPYAGAAHVFRRDGSMWRRQAYLKASHPGAGDEFGHHLHLSEHGDVLAVGAALEASAASHLEADPSDDSAPAAGAVVLFASDGTSWQQHAFVKSPYPDAGDRMGWSMALSADGALLAAGASREASAATGIGGDARDDSASRAGAVFLYRDLLDGG